MNRDPIEEHGGLNIYSAFENSPCEKMDIYGLKTYNFDENTYYLRVSFAPSDIVIHDGIHLTVRSGNLYLFQEGTALGKLECALKHLGFSLPAGKELYAYKATFRSTNAWTLEYGILRAHKATFISDHILDNLNAELAEFRVVTFWHELKGHQIDGGDDGPEFDALYEAPVIAAVNAAKSTKSNWKCGSCVTEAFGEKAWKINNMWEEILCKCSINPRL